MLLLDNNVDDSVYALQLQAEAGAIEADIEIILPPEAADNPNLQDDLTSEFKENAGDFKTQAVPGLTVDPESLGFSQG